MKTILVILFVLIFQAGTFVSAQQRKSNTSTSTQKKQEQSEPIDVSAYDNRIVVSNAPIGSTLEIYSVVGIKVKEIEMKQSSGEYAVNLAKGYYIVRLDDTVRKITIK